MDPTNPTIKLCLAGARAEFEGRKAEAQAFYQQAWEIAQDDYEACIAAHYVARFQPTPPETLQWNLEALTRAQAVKDERIQSFYPSLYVNLGHSYEVLGNIAEAKRYYDLAATLGIVHNS